MFVICGAFGTGWQRPIGCLKLQVIFRKRATNYRALLRKITYKDKAFYGSSSPCSKATFENCNRLEDRFLEWGFENCDF